MFKINKIVLTSLLIALPCLLVVACQTKQSQQTNLKYDFHLLSENFQQNVSQEAHNALVTSNDKLLYLNPEEAENSEYQFLNSKNLRLIKNRLSNSNLSNFSNFELLLEEEQKALEQDLKLLVEQSQVEQNLLKAIKNDLSKYNKILDFEDQKSWFENVSFDLTYFDLGYFDFNETDYIGHIEFDLIFNYRYKNPTNQIVKSSYQEEIVLTITNQNEIIEELKYLHTDLRTDLLKDKFIYAWIDAQQLLVTEYEKMFNLPSLNEQFTKIFAFNAFEKSFLKYIKDNQPINENSIAKINFDLVFKTENRFASYQQIEQVQNFSLDLPNYGSEVIYLNDDDSLESLKNIELYKAIFGFIDSNDKITLENKSVLGNKSLYIFLEKNWVRWIAEFQTKFNQKFGVNSSSTIGYGEISLNDMALYFEEFNYYHPIQKISYYVAISIDKSDDKFLNESNYSQDFDYKTNSIFKAFYMNSFNAIKNFQTFFGTRGLNWTKVSEAESLIKFDPQTNFDFWESVGKLKKINIFELNDKLSLVDSFNAINEQRNYFLENNNNDLFHLRILPTKNLINFPVIKYKLKEIFWSSFDQSSDDFLTISIALSFINIDFVINEKKFYEAEKSLLKI